MVLGLLSPRRLPLAQPFLTTQSSSLRQDELLENGSMSCTCRRFFPWIGLCWWEKAGCWGAWRGCPSSRSPQLRAWWQSLCHAAWNHVWGGSVNWIAENIWAGKKCRSVFRGGPPSALICNLTHAAFPGQQCRTKEGVANGGSW